MADTKISVLTSASTPLAGTEVLPIVQSGTTVKVSADNITAGRAVSASSLTLTGSPLPTTSGGTGQTSWTSNGVLYASNTTTLATTSTFAFDGSNLAIGAAANANSRLLVQKADNTVYTSGARGYLWQQIYNTSTTSGAYVGLELAVEGVGNGSLASLATIDAGSGTTEFAISTRVANTFADSLYIDSSRNIKAVSGNLVIGTSGKGITDSTSTTALNFTSTYASFVGGKWLVGTTTASGLGGATPVNISSGTGAAGIGSKASSGTGAIDTSISINQGPSGGTILLLASRNTGAGTATDSAVYVVRFYYDGNNAPTTSYIGGSTDFVTFGVSGSNTLTVTNSAGGNVNYSWFGNK